MFLSFPALNDDQGRAATFLDSSPLVVADMACTCCWRPVRRAARRLTPCWNWRYMHA